MVSLINHAGSPFTGHSIHLLFEVFFTGALFFFKSWILAFKWASLRNILLWHLNLQIYLVHILRFRKLGILIILLNFGFCFLYILLSHLGTRTSLILRIWVFILNCSCQLRTLVRILSLSYTLVLLLWSPTLSRLVCRPLRSLRTFIHSYNFF